MSTNEHEQRPNEHNLVAGTSTNKHNRAGMDERERARERVQMSKDEHEDKGTEGKVGPVSANLSGIHPHDN
jgi:hypothetical protein